MLKDLGACVRKVNLKLQTFTKGKFEPHHRESLSEPVDHRHPLGKTTNAVKLGIPVLDLRSRTPDDDEGRTDKVLEGGEVALGSLGFALMQVQGGQQSLLHVGGEWSREFTEEK